MPREWYYSLPRSGEVAQPPVAGITLLQISLMVEGLALLGVFLLGWRFVPLRRSSLLDAPEASPHRPDLGGPAALGILLVITALALALRLINLDSDLWLDEIITVVVYSPMSFMEVMGGYINFNNHLLNTLLVKLSLGLFGETEWAVRLPAALLGTTSIPVMYWVSRQLGFSRALSLGLALLLAVSYHHIFFSQNARGYIGLVLFSLLASGLLVRALQTDRPAVWALYVAVMFLNFASLLTSAYVLAGHMLVGAAALWVVYRRGVSPQPLIRRLAVVFGLAGFLAFQLYALVLPHAYMRAQAKYTSEGGYFSLFSTDLLAEVLRSVSTGIGLGAGPPATVVLLAGALVASAGYWVLLRRHWSLTLALSLPILLSLLFLVINGLTFSPRFFLPALPVALLAAVQGVYTVGSLAGKSLGERQRQTVSRVAAAALVVGVVGVSAVSLISYYSTPKQAYRASIQYLENQRVNGESVIVVDLAEQGYRYYGGATGGGDDPQYHFVQTVEELDAVLSAHSHQDSYVVTTLSRFLRQRKPELEARIQEDWRIIRSFPGTIGDGQISVWGPQ